MKSAGKVYDYFSNSPKKWPEKKSFNWFFILKIKLSPFTSCFIEIAEDYPCQIMWWPRIQFNSWATLREFTCEKQVTEKKYNEIMNYCVFYSFYLAPTRKNQHQSAHALCLNSTAYSWVMKVNLHLKQCASVHSYLV